MIWYWLLVVVPQWFVWLFKLPKPEEIAKANVNERCPVCGARKGWLRCVYKMKPGPRHPEREMQLKAAMVKREHNCQVCGAGWYSDPIAKVSVEEIRPSPPRTDLEVTMDRRERVALYEEGAN